jgi:hypothetical protein
MILFNQKNKLENENSRSEIIMLIEYQLSTSKEDLYNITAQVRKAVTKSGVTDGIATENFMSL